MGAQVQGKGREKFPDRKDGVVSVRSPSPRGAVILGEGRQPVAQGGVAERGPGPALPLSSLLTWLPSRCRLRRWRLACGATGRPSAGGKETLEGGSGEADGRFPHRSFVDGLRSEAGLGVVAV